MLLVSWFSINLSSLIWCFLLGFNWKGTCFYCRRYNLSGIFWCLVSGSLVTGDLVQLQLYAPPLPGLVRHSRYQGAQKCTPLNMSNWQLFSLRYPLPMYPLPMKEWENCSKILNFEAVCILTHPFECQVYYVPQIQRLLQPHFCDTFPT